VADGQTLTLDPTALSMMRDMLDESLRAARTDQQDWIKQNVFGGQLPPDENPIWKSLASSTFNAASDLFSTSGPLGDTTAVGIDSLAPDMITYWIDRAKDLGSIFVRPATDWMGKQFGQGPVDPTEAFGRGMEALTLCSGLGIGAHIVSALFSKSFMGSGLMNTAGVGAALAEAGGFSPVISTLMKPFHEAYFGAAWQRRVNTLFRPAIPGPGEILALRRERHIDPDAGSNMIGTDTQDWLAQHGYPDEWIKTLVAACWTKPRQRELMILAESETLSDAFLEESFKDVGYTDPVVAKMVDAFKARRIRTYRQQWLAVEVSAVEQGFQTVDDLDNELRRRNWPEDVVNEIHFAATEKRRLYWSKRYVDWADLAYERDELSDSEYADALGAAGMDGDTQWRMYAMARLKRYHKVWRTTPAEDAREVLSIYVDAFKANLITRGELHLALEATEMDADAAGLIELQADEVRQKGIIGNLRQYGLPALRDAAAEGAMSRAEYAARLKGLGFPEEKLGAELFYADVLKARYVAKRFEAKYVPAVEGAYVQGLVGRSTVQGAYDAAKIPKDEGAARLRLLDNDFKQRLLGRYVQFEQSADRAAVIAGRMTAADYRRRLELAGWPAAYIAAEADYAGAEAGRRVQGRLVRFDLTKYEAAYKLGLMGDADLIASYEAAGLSQAEWYPRAIVAAKGRDDAAARIEASQAAQAAKSAAAKPS